MTHTRPYSRLDALERWSSLLLGFTVDHDLVTLIAHESFYLESLMKALSGDSDNYLFIYSHVGPFCGIYTAYNTDAAILEDHYIVPDFPTVCMLPFAFIAPPAAAS